LLNPRAAVPVTILPALGGRSAMTTARLVGWTVVALLVAHHRSPVNAEAQRAPAGPIAGSTQGPERLDGGGDLEVGSEAARYLRLLQLSGRAPAQPWSIQPLSAPPGRGTHGFGTDSAHPWRLRWGADTTRRLTSFRWIRPGARLTFNSHYPSGSGLGPVWTGRGITGELRGGAVLSLWRLRLQAAPVLFLAQNQAFELAANGASDSRRFADARFPYGIDAPQRFGDTPYGRLDAGNSTLSLELPRLAVGVSTAAQSWGPGREFPLVLSGNAGGFPHAFIGTTAPLNLGIMRLHTRLVAGQLQQSPFSPVPDTSSGRQGTGLVLVLLPRGVDGLELGFSRFIHTRAEGVPDAAAVRRLFSGGLSGTGELNLRDENQVVSVFFRWAFPRSAFEVYGEYFRDDYSLELRRLLQYYDDLRTLMVGVQRVIQQSGTRVRSLRFELVNGELPSSNRGERSVNFPAGLRGMPLPPYLHGGVPQGHTQRGLLLGSPEAYGGAAWRAGYDQYDTRGRTSLVVERQLRVDWLPTVVPTDTTRRPAVQFAVGGEAMRFVGRREVTLSLTGMIELNRNLRPGVDVPNVRAALTLRGVRP
jgi:hypothetical protein